MCGFAGELVFDGAAQLSIAVAMAGRLAHRGPDEAGQYLSPDGRCAIGFRRLSVVDPARSHQPMVSADGECAIAFNGEIYNFASIRSDLRADGATFATAGDTEVLLQLYCRRGLEMFPRLRGMFAFAIYDVPAGLLVLARDRLGQKPLWYAPLADRVIFASEAKALLAHPAIIAQVDPATITDYLALGYIPAPRSIWRGIFKLLPGSYATVIGPSVEPVHYWRPRPIASLPHRREEVRQIIQRRVTDAVLSHRVADVPLGVLLSGGIDSAIIAAVLAEAAGAAGGVRTFTAGFADGPFDEGSAAREVAEQLGTEHTELLVRPDASTAVDQIVAMYDEPFGDSSALPTSLICQAARQDVTVALGGDGGDEAFGGYDRYRAIRLSESLRGPGYLAVRLAAAAAKPFAGGHERTFARRLVRLAEALPHPYAMQYWMYRRLFGPVELARLLNPDFVAGEALNAAEQWFIDLYEDIEADDEVTRAQLHDLATYLPDDLLVKTDIASMAASLELRAPFLDHEVIELGLGLPTDAKFSRGRGKAILREAFADKLPRRTLAGRKRGFGLPLARWLREDLQPQLRDVLMSDALLGLGIFQKDALAGLINDHVLGRVDHSHRLWALLVLGRWLLDHR